MHTGKLVNLGRLFQSLSPDTEKHGRRLVKNIEESQNIGTREKRWNSR